MQRDALIDLLTPIAEFGQPGPNGAMHIDVGNDGYLQYFGREILGGLIKAGGATCRFFEGPYGSGKTHILKLIRELALRNGSAVAAIELSQAVHIYDWKLIAATILRSIEVRIAGQTVRGIPSVLQALADDGRADVMRLAASSQPHAGFRNAMRLCASGKKMGEEPSQLLSDYLLGERIGVGQFKHVGIYGIRDPLSRKNAEQVLATAFGSLHALGLQGTVLEFDENEQMLRRSNAASRRTQVAANLIRRLIDACATGELSATVVVFAVLPEFLSHCAWKYPALGQRLHQELEEDKYGWRWPILSLGHTAEGLEPEEFMEQAIDKLMECVGGLGDGTIEGQLRQAGRGVLERNAGLGYRREMMKTLATVIVERIG